MHRVAKFSAEPPAFLSKVGISCAGQRRRDNYTSAFALSLLILHVFKGKVVSPPRHAEDGMWALGGETQDQTSLCGDCPCRSLGTHFHQNISALMLLSSRHRQSYRTGTRSHCQAQAEREQEGGGQGEEIKKSEE